MVVPLYIVPPHLSQCARAIPGVKLDASSSARLTRIKIGAISNLKNVSEGRQAKSTLPSRQTFGMTIATKCHDLGPFWYSMQHREVEYPYERISRIFFPIDVKRICLCVSKQVVQRSHSSESCWFG